MDQNSGGRYITKERIFRNNGTVVSYPFIVSGDSERKIDSLNEIILGDVNKILDIYSADAFASPAGESDFFPADTLHIRYDIMRNDAFYLSIFYTADFYSPYGAYPTQMVYTTNIDLQNERRIKLSDITPVDDGFINDILSGTPVNTDPKYIRGIQDYFLGLGRETLRRGFNSADIIGPDNVLGIFSYLKPGILGISISLPIYLGNHAEYEKNIKI